MFQRELYGNGAAEPEYSIICAYNDKDKLERFLIASLRKQGASFELLTIDNCGNAFKGAPAVLNSVAREARSDWLVFAHQDIVLTGADWLEQVSKALRRLGMFGAAGVAGGSAAGIKSSVWHGYPPQFSGGKQVEEPEEVQTLDGCLMIVSKSVFLQQGFDEDTCRGWYLYVADYCLDLARRGLPVYVLPHKVYHAADTNASRDYSSSLQALLKKHRPHVSRIHATVGTWDTSPYAPRRMLLALRKTLRLLGFAPFRSTGR